MLFDHSQDAFGAEHAFQKQVGTRKQTQTSEELGTGPKHRHFLSAGDSNYSRDLGDRPSYSIRSNILLLEDSKFN